MYKRPLCIRCIDSRAAKWLVSECMPRIAALVVIAICILSFAYQTGKVVTSGHDADLAVTCSPPSLLSTTDPGPGSLAIMAVQDLPGVER